AEMHEQDFAGRKIDEEILGAPAQPLDRLALQPGDEVLRQRPAQVAAMRLHLGEAGALHDRLQPAADRLDFRQFWHHELPRETYRPSFRRAMVLPQMDYSPCRKPAKIPISDSSRSRLGT